MLIDWFTVSAQLLNFLLLLYLLKRFLYRPILQAMDKREKVISDRLDEAEKIRVEAEKTAAEYQQQKHHLEEQRSQLLEKAKTAAEEYSKKLTSQVKVETEEMRNSWSEAVQRERTLFLDELKKRTAAEVLRISRKSMTVLTGADLQTQLTNVLLEKLQRLPLKEKDKCAKAASKTAPKVRTSFALDARQEGEITAALQQLCRGEVPVTYTADLTMPFGIEVTLGELRISWGIQRYFEELEKNVTELLAPSVSPVAKTVGVDGDG